MEKLETYQLAVWTFKRSREPLEQVTELYTKDEYCVQQWEANGYYFGVWKPWSDAMPEQEATREWPKFPPEDVDGYRQYRNFFGETGRVSLDRVGEHWSVWISIERSIFDFLTAKKPATFRFPNLMVRSSHGNYKLAIRDPVPGEELGCVLREILRTDHERNFPESAPPEAAARAREICNKVADQVVKAVMSNWKAEHGAVDEMFPLDPNLYSCNHTVPALPPLAQDSEELPPSPEVEAEYLRVGKALYKEVVENLKHAALYPEKGRKAVFCIGDLSPDNIVLDDQHNFVGFRRVGAASYAPQDWIQIGLIDPAAKAEAGISVARSCVLPGRYDIPKKGANSIRLVWLTPLSDKLAANGFAKLDTHRLRWRRNEEGAADRQREA